MSSHSTSKSDMTNNSSAAGDNNLMGPKPIATFQWTTTLENCLLRNMTGLKPCGINKHISMLLLKERMDKELKIKIPIRVLWDYIETKWDIRAADIIEHVRFDTSDKDFVLPKEYDQLIAEEGEKIKKLEEKSLNDEINKKKLLKWSGKTRSKSNSMSSVNSKECLNETVPSTLLESFPVKTNGVGSDDDPCTSRSLHTNDKLENSKSEEKNKLKDLKQLNKNISIQMEKVDKISNFKGQKRKSRNVSFSSHNSKQRRSYKKNFKDLTISDNSSRSVNPETLRGTTSNRSVTQETKSKGKVKIRSRVTSDHLVIQQSLEIQSLGRRSCSNKKS